MVKRYIKDGKVAVLVTNDYGAGWSTRNPEHAEFLTMSKCLVKAVLAKDFQRVADLASSHCGNIYCGGAKNLVVVWVEPGSQFEILEHDGYESIHVIGSREYLTA